MLCLASELRDGGAEVDATAEDFNCPAADALVGFSPTMWSTMGMLEQVTAPFDGGIELIANGNSWGSFFLSLVEVCGLLADGYWVLVILPYLFLTISQVVL
jgi:hypothetical protein